MSRPSNSSPFDDLNNIWPVVQITTLLVMTLSPTVLHFLLLRSKFSFLECAVFFFLDEGPSHHSLKAFCATPMMMIDGWAVFYQFLQLMEHHWIEIDRGKPTTRRKTCPSATLSTTNLTWTWPGTEPRASVVRGRQLTAWAMARPECTVYSLPLMWETKFHTCIRQQT
jgi:hypothetical protein